MATAQSSFIIIIIIIFIWLSLLFLLYDYYYITISIGGWDLKAGGIHKGQEKKQMKWLRKIRNKLKLMTKKDTTENCPQYQENYQFVHAPCSSERKKMLGKMSWRRAPGHISYPKFVSKEPVITSQNRAVQPNSVFLSVCPLVPLDGHQYVWEHLAPKVC